jgi:hypothetical protein
VAIVFVSKGKSTVAPASGAAPLLELLLAVPPLELLLVVPPLLELLLPPASGLGTVSFEPEEHAPPQATETRPSVKIQLACIRRFFGNTLSSLEFECAWAEG